MGATLPIIDIGPYLTKDADPAARAQVSKQLHEACVKYGFFYLDLSKFVDPSTPEELVNLGRQFFSLPQDEKNKIGLIHQDGARGYQRLKENVTNGKADNHEGLDFYKPVDNPDKTKPLWGENQWPAAIPEFEPKFTAWTNKMKELGIIVMEAYVLSPCNS
jgi:isopenicillin N synthase-like dioxygenase